MGDQPPNSTNFNKTQAYDCGMCQLCAKIRARCGAMAGKAGQIIPRGDRTWLVRVFMGRDSESEKRK